MNLLYIFALINKLAQGIVMGKGKQAFISRCQTGTVVFVGLTLC